MLRISIFCSNFFSSFLLFLTMYLYLGYLFFFVSASSKYTGIVLQIQVSPLNTFTNQPGFSRAEQSEYSERKSGINVFPDSSKLIFDASFCSPYFSRSLFAAFAWCQPKNLFCSLQIPGSVFSISMKDKPLSNSLTSFSFILQEIIYIFDVAERHVSSLHIAFSSFIYHVLLISSSDISFISSGELILHHQLSFPKIISFRAKTYIAG